MTATLARPEILALKPYETALQQANTLRLNANEAPRSPLADGLNRYPPIRPQALQDALAALFGVANNRLLATRGSSEAIDLLTRTFCRAYQDNVLVLPPTFSMYQVYARMQGADVIEVPLDAADDFQLPVDEVLQNCDDNTKLIFLCAPNNPTGGSIPEGDILRLLQARNGRSLVVVDEAYIEFSRNPSLLGQLDDYDNLVILRTLSKAWGLAGTRCGAVLASPAIIELLNRMLPPYAFSSPSVDRVLQSLSEAGQANAKELIAATIHERDKLCSALTKLPCVDKVWPSDSNFLLVRFKSLLAVDAVLSPQNILIRKFSGNPVLQDCARVTVGDAEQNALLLAALATLPENGV